MVKTFGAESTADEVLEGVNLSGKRVLVTGVSAGLGVETARSIVAHGGTVVGTARDLSKARRALADAGNPSVELVEMDLASLASVRKAASELLVPGKPFDVIISAGYRIGPFEVESALLEHSAVMESAVVASPTPIAARSSRPS